MLFSFDLLSEGPAYYLVTQTDVVRYLARKLLTCSDKARYQTVATLFPPLNSDSTASELYPVTPSTLAIDAFYRMLLHERSTLPVVRLFGCIPTLVACYHSSMRRIRWTVSA